MAITLSRRQRDALYEHLIIELVGSEDIAASLARGEIENARRLRDRFSAALLLLDALGWEPHDPREQFPLPISSGQLAVIMRPLHTAIVAHLEDHPDEAGENALLARDTAAEILRQLGIEPEDDAPAG
jgi:hypothetical protein